MASSLPAILPITNPKSTTSTTDSTLYVPGPTPAFQAFIKQISETVRNGMEARWPWSELVDRSAFSKPESLSDAAVRIRKNYAYFRSNYVSIVAVVLGVSLLTNPLSLIFLAALLVNCLFLYFFRTVGDHPLTIFGRQLSKPERICNWRDKLRLFKGELQFEYTVMEEDFVG